MAAAAVININEGKYLMTKSVAAEAAPRLSKLQRLEQEIAAAKAAQAAKVVKKNTAAIEAHTKALAALDTAEKKVAAIQAELDDIAAEATALGVALPVVGDEDEPVTNEDELVDPEQA